MNNTRIKNALIFDSEKRAFKKGGLTVENGRITGFSESETAVDFDGDLIIPGLVDVHTHGRGGCDFNSASVAELKKMKKEYAAKGVTTVVPTLASDTLENILAAVGRIKDAGFQAIHLEGRYMNPKHRGAHRADLLVPLDADEINSIIDRAGGMKVHVSAAYELDRDYSFLNAVLSRGCTAGLAHTDATYEQACDAVAHGVKSFTHLFNCMPPLHHRAGGAASAGLLTDAYTEIICDGFHLSPETVRLIGAVKSPDRVVLITDSMEGTGCPDGSYKIGGNSVTLKDGKAYTADGAIAGSTLELLDGLKNYAEFRRIPFAGAVNCATSNPAAMIGINAGTLTPGAKAEFLRLSPDFVLKEIYQ